MSSVVACSVPLGANSLSRQSVARFTKFIVIIGVRNYQPTHPLLVVAQEMHLPLFRTPMITMNFVNLATLCLDNEFAPSGTEHATTLDIKGVGVMLRG